MSLKKRKQRISIDLQDHVLRFISVKAPDVNSVISFGERRLPKGIIERGKIVDHEGLERFIKKSVRKWKIKHREVLFHVPDSLVFLRKVEIPENISEEEIKSYLYMEVGESILLPFENPIFDYVLLPENENLNKEILLFASPRPLVIEYAGIFEKASLKPVAADITTLSCYRFLNAMGMTDPNEHLMCIQFNREMANVSLFHNDKPFFTRQLMGESISGEEYTPTESNTHFQLSDSFQELSRIMNFYTYSLNQGDAQVSKIIVMGDHPEIADITESLSQFTGIPVVTMPPEELINLSMKKKMPNRFLLTLGLALKEVE